VITALAFSNLTSLPLDCLFGFETLALVSFTLLELVIRRGWSPD
jgi:hypothetical protein